MLVFLVWKALRIKGKRDCWRHTYANKTKEERITHGSQNGLDSGEPKQKNWISLVMSRLIGAE